MIIINAPALAGVLPEGGGMGELKTLHEEGVLGRPRSQRVL